jgi:hypothetical protein
MRRRLLWGIGLLILLGNVQFAFAHDVLQGDSCTIAAEQQIEGNVFALCRTLIVSGVINGDLFGGGSTIQVDGTVNGSLYLVGGQLDIRGKIGKDIHFGGGVLTLKPTAQFLSSSADVISASMSTEVDGVRVPGSITSISYQLLINGAVSREISFWGSALTINGAVDGDVTATVGDPASTGVSELRTLFGFLPIDLNLIDPGLRVTESGAINGQLRYAGPTEGEIAVTLAHPTEYTPVNAQTGLITPDNSLAENLREYLGAAVRELVSLALIGLAALLVIPRAVQTPIYSLRVRPLTSFGIGLLTFIISISIFFIVIPLLGFVLVLLLLVLQLSDLAIIAGAIVLLLDLGGAGLFYFGAIFISRVIVCLALGRFVVRLLLGDRPERSMTFVSLLIGVALLSIFSTLPYIGFIVNALAAFLGLGAMLNIVQTQLERAREAVVLPEPTHPEEARQLPPPALIEDKPLGPGMDNLPDGFKWWM